MTRTTNARVAGVTFLLYIVIGIATLILSNRATGGEVMAAKLAGVALSSLLLLAALPMRLAGFLPGPLVQYLWLPMAVFEVVFAVWLIVKGAALPARRVVT